MLTPTRKACNRCHRAPRAAHLTTCEPCAARNREECRNRYRLRVGIPLDAPVIGRGKCGKRRPDLISTSSPT